MAHRNTFILTAHSSAHSHHVRVGPPLEIHAASYMSTWVIITFKYTKHTRIDCARALTSRGQNHYICRQYGSDICHGQYTIASYSLKPTKKMARTKVDNMRLKWIMLGNRKNAQMTAHLSCDKQRAATQPNGNINRAKEIRDERERQRATRKKLHISQHKRKGISTKATKRARKNDEKVRKSRPEWSILGVFAHSYKQLTINMRYGQFSSACNYKFHFKLWHTGEYSRAGSIPKICYFYPCCFYRCRPSVCVPGTFM